MWCGLCGFLIIKPQTALHHAVWCGAVQYYLRCVAIMPFCGRFWCSFCGLYGLCGLVNTHNLPCLSSDHCPLLINPTGIEIPSYKKPFRFEEMWLSDSSCGEVVDAAWRSCVVRDSDSEIIRKIDKCGKDLSWWNYNVFGNVRRELKKKRDLLIEEEAVVVRTGSNFQIKALKDEINVLMDREARMWNQRSHILWLKNGDGNTKFFHTRASHRFRKNVILGINDPLGS